MASKRISAFLFIAIVLIGTMATVPRFASAAIAKEGTAIFRAGDLPSLVGTPENNIRFALWNGTTWFELPFSLNKTKVQRDFVNEVDGTTIKNTVSTESATICEADVFSVRIPAMLGLNTTIGEWWSMALDLCLSDRLSVQLSDDTGYSCIVFVYYRTSGSCLRPDYSSYYNLPLFSSSMTQTQMNQTTSVTVVGTPSYKIATFDVQSFSEPQIAKTAASSQDPPVYSVQTILEKEFSNTGNTALPTDNFYLPQQNMTISSVFLVVEWNPIGDTNSRQVIAYINGYQVYSGYTVRNVSGSTGPLDIKNRVNWWKYNPDGSYAWNNASVTLTTYAGYGTFDVRAYIYVEYTAATHFINVRSDCAQGFYVNTSRSGIIEPFPTSLPDNAVDQSGAETVTIEAWNDSDSHPELLYLYVNGVWDSEWLVTGPFVKVSFDITNQVLWCTSVTIGIALQCQAGYWTYDAYITTMYRPSMAPDVDGWWLSPTNIQTLTRHSGNLYADAALTPDTDKFAGTWATQTEGYQYGTPWCFYTGLTVTYPNPDDSFAVCYMQTNISIIQPNGQILPNSYYSPPAGFCGSSSGIPQCSNRADDDIGLACLSAASLLLGIESPGLGALLGLAALVLRYGTGTPPAMFTVSPVSTGVMMTFQTTIDQMNYSAPQSMLLRWQMTWPASGLYTVDVQTAVETADSACKNYGFAFTDDRFPLDVRKDDVYPLLNVTASTGGDTDPYPNVYMCSWDCSPMVTAIPASGYAWNCWYKDNTYYSNSLTVPVTMDAAQHSLRAFFLPTLTISISGGSSSCYTTPDGLGVHPESFGQHVTETAIAPSGYVFEYWSLDGNVNSSNPITVTMNVPHTLVAVFSTPAGGGGCPYVSTWNGSQYVLDNNLLAASMFSGGEDVKDSYVLQQSLAENPNDTWSLLLSEFENEHDFIDQVQLVAVDHALNINVGVSPSGQILTYANPNPPISAITDTHENAKQLLSAIDGRYYEAHNGSYVILNFGDLDVSQAAKLVLRMDAYKDPVYVQVQDSKGTWNTVAEVIPRVNWSTDIIDMSKFLPDARGNLKVRLYFTADLKVDFVGLDTSPQAKVNVHEGHLVSAISSADGNVTSKLLLSDQTYAELVPGESIQLQFTLPPQTMQTRTYIIIIEGHYYTITP